MSAHTGIPIPPTAFAAAAILQWLAPKTTTAVALRRTAAMVLATGAGWLMGSTLGAYRRHGTTLDPTEPELTTVLVEVGANKLSRNPLYVGMLGMLAAHAALRGSWQTWLPVAAFAATINRFQIPHEEQALRDKFGAVFDDYCARTPRWLGKPKR